MLRDIIKKYLDWCSVYRSKSTCEDYAEIFRIFLKTESEYTDESIMAFIQSEKLKGNSAVTINTKLSALKSLGEWAYSRHMMPDDVYRRIDKLPVTKTEKVTALNLDAANIMHKAHKREGRGWINYRDTAIMNVFIVTGCRVSELINIKLDDVSLDAGLITIRHGKGNKERTVCLSEGCINAIKKYLERVCDMDNPERLLFFSSRPMPSGSRKLSRQAVYLVTKGITEGECGCHKLRHLAATTMLNNDIPLDTVQEVLGHASVNTTKIYAERNTAAKLAAARAVGV